MAEGVVSDGGTLLILYPCHVSCWSARYIGQCMRRVFVTLRPLYPKPHHNAMLHLLPPSLSKITDYFSKAITTRPTYEVMVIKTRKDGAAKVKGAKVQAKDEDRWPTP